MHRNVPMMQIFIYATCQFLLRICLQVLLTDLSREDKNPLAMYYCGLPTQHCDFLGGKICREKYAPKSA